MTGEELAALIEAEIGESEQLQRILDRIQDGSATFTDSELYAAITAEITAKQMRRNVLSLDGREAAFADITRQRHSDTFTVFSAVQRILDARSGIRIKPQKPPFEEGRAHKIGHALEDKTVPESTIERRAESATENFCRSHHDDCMKVNAQFRDRAGLQSYAIRDCSAKCCDWCADVSGKYPANETPQGFWGRHDNCKCSILYESKRSGRQLLRGTSKKWEVVAPDAGAGALHRLSGDEAAAAGAPEPVRFTRKQATEQERRHLPVKLVNGQATENSKIKTEFPQTLVDISMLTEPEYRRLFGQFSETQRIEREIFHAARSALSHRNGTKFEDLYFIDTSTGRVLSRTDFDEVGRVEPSHRMMQMIRSSQRGTIIGVHNHPTSTVPSIDDIQVARVRGYKYGVVVCHNGNMFQYTVNGDFNATYVDLLLDNLNRNLYNIPEDEEQAERQRRAVETVLEELRKNNVDLKVILWK